MSFLSKIAKRIMGKGLPRGELPGESTFADQFRTQKTPSIADLLNADTELVYSYARINAQAVASAEVTLFATTGPGQSRPKCAHRPVNVETGIWLKSMQPLSRKLAGTEAVDEITSHPLLDLLNDVNPEMESFGLMELTQLYLEVPGIAYWILDFDPTLGFPTAIWPVPPDMLEPVLKKDSVVVRHYKYGPHQVVVPIHRVISFRMPHLRNPYTHGQSPTRAGWETVNLLAKDRSFAAAMLDNRARPDTVVALEDAGGEEELERYERKINKKYRQGGAGRVWVIDGRMKVQSLGMPSRQFEGMDRVRLARQLLANLFDVPLTMVDTTTMSRANAQAGLFQHAKLGVLPRLIRMYSRLNQTLVPLFDDRLFLWFKNPVPEDEERQVRQREINIRTGVSTINEERLDDGRSPVSWGHEPWMPMNFRQPSDEVVKPGQPTPKPKEATNATS